MEARKQCAYNQTRGRVLGMEVDAGDFSPASLGDRTPALTPKSGAGLWLLPFRGISAANVRTPLDLIYLDANCEVIDVVESFPISLGSTSIEPAASVLALPTRTIDSTKTQTGDRLLLCAAEEMTWRIKRMPSPSQAPSASQAPARRKEEPNPGSILHLAEWENRAPAELSAEGRQPRPASRSAFIESGTKSVNPAKSWLERWLNPNPPDLRKSPRESLPCLAAYFWTGGAPEEHCIRDVSPTGLYVVTEERWYLGTVVRMTLTDSSEPSIERSITVHATAVRWGNDGVGLHFVVQGFKGKRRGLPPIVEGIDKKQLDRFLGRIRNGSG
ncbi:MAG: PilZ domain-containing protein [Terracidiphilus sp.]